MIGWDIYILNSKKQQKLRYVIISIEKWPTI